MKRVSFEIAKYLREVGYPQDLNEGTVFYAENGLMDKYDSELYEFFDPMFCVCPYVMEVWLWLWREKKIYIDIDCSDSYTSVASMLLKGRNFFDFFEKDDPEEAIVAAIEHLVTNKLIK